MEIYIKVNGNKKVEMAFDPKHHDILNVCRSLSIRRWGKKSKTWTSPSTPFMAAEIYKKCKAQGIKIKSDHKFLGLLKEYQRINRAQDYKYAQQFPEIPIRRFDPWTHQAQAYWFADAMPYAMLAMDMGTGKTKVSVDTLQNNAFKLMVVVCPKSVVSVWPKEFKKHCVVPYSIFPLDSGRVDKRSAKIKYAVDNMKRTNRPLIFVVNYESTRSGAMQEVLLKFEWDFLVIDESHKIKSPSGKDSAFCRKLANTSGKVFELTGTPMPHSPLDIFAQFRAMDIGIFGSSFTEFKKTYAELGFFNEFKRIKPEMADEMNRVFNLVSYQCQADDVFDDLPDKRHEIVTCTMSAEGQKIYDAIEEEMYAQLDAGEITPQNQLVKRLRLLQVASGYVADDDGKIHKVDDSKEKTLEEYVDNISSDEAIAIFYRFNTDREAIKKMAENLGRGFCELSGHADNLAEWQESEDGENQIIAIQLQAGGVGVDITRARYCFYYNISDTRGDYLQSLKRIHRPGQKRNVIYYHIVVLGSVETKIYKSFAEKESTTKYIMDNRGKVQIDVLDMESKFNAMKTEESKIS